MAAIVAVNNPSICVPFIFSNISRTRIHRVFTDLELGEVETIDIHLDKNCQRAFIHFKFWHTTQRVQDIKQRLLDGEELKVIYDDPWFWKCSLYRRKGDRKLISQSSIQKVQRKLVSLRREYKIMLESKNAEIKALYDLISELSDGKIRDLDSMLLRRKHTQQRIAAKS